MRIAQVTCVYPPYRGGIGKIAQEYTTRLTALGHTVEVFQPTRRFGNAGLLASVNALRAFDVVHLHYPFYGAAEPIALASLRRGFPPIVLTFHMDATAEGLKGRLFDLHRKCLQPMILSRAKKILVSSRDYAEHASLAKLGSSEKTVEIPFGVDTKRFYPRVGDHVGSPLRAQMNIPHDVPVLLFVGGLDRAHIFKGLPVLLDALPALSKPWHLVVVGSGELKASFEATAEMLGCRHNVHFAGAVGDEELPEYYRLADIHVFPSTSRAEAFGIVALEAAASGIPTIASDLPGVRTVVANERTGLLAPPGNPTELAKAIDDLLLHRERREAFGNQARARAEKEYAWDVLMDRLVRVYEEVKI